MQVLRGGASSEIIAPHVFADGVWERGSGSPFFDV